MKRALLVALTASAVATSPLGAEENDPLEPLNRKMLGLNYVIDKVLVQPLAKGYVTVVPGFVRLGIRNALDNLSVPRTVLNQCLQGKFGLAASDASRFVVNSTIGLGGLLDPATEMGLVRHDEDFGQTLGRWGVGQGPYVVLPVFGPSTLRDGSGRLVDVATGTRHVIEEDEVRYGLGFIRMIDARSGWLGDDAALPSDPYVYLRDSYLDRRAREVADEAAPENEAGAVAAEDSSGG